MRGAALVETQRLMAQSISALAEHIDQSSGYQLTPVLFSELPTPKRGMIACITDSSVTSGAITGGGTNVVLGWYNGTAWKVMAT